MAAVAPTIGTLRPALELAWAVAKAGTQSRPPIPPPGRLRPLMRFAKLPDRALATVQQVVEDDPVFRARVVEWADEEKLERQAWVWLVRPDGWEEELGIERTAVGLTPPGPGRHDDESSGPRRPPATSEAGGAGVAGGLADPELARLRYVNAQLEEKLSAEADARRRAEADREAMAAARATASEDQQRVVPATPPDAQSRVELDRLHQLNAELEEKLSAEADARRQAEADRDAHEVARRRALADREATESARQAAADERDRLEEAVTALENRVSSLGDGSGEEDDAAGEPPEPGQKRDTARDQIALLTEHLQEARGEAARLRADRDAQEGARRQAEADREAADAAREAADAARQTADAARQTAEANRQTADTARQTAEAARQAAEAARESAEAAREAADEERGRAEAALTALESSVSSLGTDRDATAEELTQISQARDSANDQIAGLTEQLQEARAEALRLQTDLDSHEQARRQAEAERDATEVARQQAEADREATEADREALEADREALEADRRAAEEKRDSLQEEVTALEGRVVSLENDLEQISAQLSQASQERDIASDRVALLLEQLQVARAETTRLQVGREEIRAAAGRGVARAAEAARLLSEALAEAAWTRSGEAEEHIDASPASERLLGHDRLTGGARQAEESSALEGAGVAGDRAAATDPARMSTSPPGGRSPGTQRGRDLLPSEAFAEAERRQSVEPEWLVAEAPQRRGRPSTAGDGIPDRDRMPGREENPAGEPRRRTPSPAPDEGLPGRDRLSVVDRTGETEPRRDGRQRSTADRSRSVDPNRTERPVDPESGGPPDVTAPGRDRTPADEDRQDGEGRRRGGPPPSGEQTRESTSSKSGGADTAPRQSRPPTVRRRPVPLPPAVFDDSVEAATHLVRVAGILLIVDGYNVTMSSWPNLELSRQRHQLVDALAELAMRAGTLVQVVFDGADVSGRFGPPPAARRLMRVTFSPEGVEADQVIMDLVDHLDPAQSVVVATNDRQLQEDVRRRGGNVITVAQLLGVIGRSAEASAGMRWPRSRPRKGQGAG